MRLCACHKEKRQVTQLGLRLPDLNARLRASLHDAGVDADQEAGIELCADSHILSDLPSAQLVVLPKSGKREGFVISAYHREVSFCGSPLRIQEDCGVNDALFPVNAKSGRSNAFMRPCFSPQRYFYPNMATFQVLDRGDLEALKLRDSQETGVSLRHGNDSWKDSRRQGQRDVVKKRAFQTKENRVPNRRLMRVKAQDDNQQKASCRRETSRLNACCLKNSHWSTSSENPRIWNRALTRAQRTRRGGRAAIRPQQSPSRGSEGRITVSSE